jgi:hypothetical protein
MALTQEQIDNIEFQKASQSLNNKMEAVRIARDVLMENDRNKPVGERGITAADITAFAQTIAQYVNQ